MIGSRARHSLAQFLELQEPVASIVMFSKYGVQHPRSRRGNCCTAC